MRNSCRFRSRNLQHGFSSHAPDFGVTGVWNKANAGLFKRAIEDHIAKASLSIPGMFRGIIPVTHYFSPVTGLWAAVDQLNTFVAGWRLYPSQVVDLLTKGDVK